MQKADELGDMVDSIERAEDMVLAKLGALNIGEARRHSRFKKPREDDVRTNALSSPFPRQGLSQPDEPRFGCCVVALTSGADQARV